MEPGKLLAAKASEAVKALYGAEVDASLLQIQPTRKEFEGDYTLAVFPLLRTSRKGPEQTAAEIGAWLGENVPEVATTNVVKGFLNIVLSPLYWAEVLADIAATAEFGQLPATGKTVMVEFSSPNTNKPLHLGHIRNNLLGDSVSRLLAAGGNQVIKATLFAVNCQQVGEGLGRMVMTAVTCVDNRNISALCRNKGCTLLGVTHCDDVSISAYDFCCVSNALAF